MPYESISGARDADFPTSISGVDLSLAQINHLAEIYDAIKAQGKVETPMAVAISNFKKTYHIESGKWIKNESDGSYWEGTSFIEFREVSIKSIMTSQAAMSYHNRLHAMYVDNRQTGKAFSKQWVIDRHKELVAWMDKNGWTHPKRGDNLDRTVETFGEAVPFDESGLKEGKPILVLRLGNEYDSLTGKKRVTITRDMAEHMVKNFNKGIRPGIEYGMPMDFDGAPNDMDHSLANTGKGEPIKKPTAADRIAGYVKKLFMSAKGIMGIPMWTQDAIDTIKRVGRIGISPYFGTKYYGKHGPGEGKDAGATFFNFTLTPRPQQTDLAVTAQALTEEGNDKEDIYTGYLPIEFEEETEMSDEKGIIFDDEILAALGDDPEAKVKSLIALAEEAEGLRKDNEEMKGKIEKLEKRPTNEAFEEVKTDLADLKSERKEREEKERKKILLFGEENKGGYVMPAQLETEEGKRWLNSEEMPRPRFDEMVKNMTRLDSKVKGAMPKDDSEIYSDASDEIAKRALKKVAEAKKNGEVLTFEEASTQVVNENPDLAKRYDDETLVK